jgi:thiamine pyrophosphate-dependent acetolactate synthase large subunit-like protein
MGKSAKPPVDRRHFLKSTSMGIAALAVAPLPSRAGQSTAPRNATAPLPPEEFAVPLNAEVLTIARPGSDFMVDIIKSIGFEYMCANPGNTFRSLHESLINYGGNQNPEFITCCHEECSVAMGHGYAKIEGKPLLVCVHGTVGLQHAAMAVYNAYCDRVPVFLLLGNIGDAAARVAQIDWVHSAQDPAAIIRDFVKWDDQPVSLPHFAESMIRAYKIAMTRPMMPVALVADDQLQEQAIPEGVDVTIPKLTLTSPPTGDPGAVAEVARLLVAAENPVFVVDRLAQTPAGMDRMVELAETLQAAVVDRNNRLNFPTHHPLNQTEHGGATVSNADLIVGLELTDFWNTVHSVHGQLHPAGVSSINPGTKLVSITAADLDMKDNYQDVQKYQAVDIALAADAEATLPALIEEVRRQITDDRKRMFKDRAAKLGRAHLQARERSLDAARYGWNSSPVSTARLCAELWAQISREDWSLVSACQRVSRWPLRLWPFDKHYQYNGGEGASGVGYQAPASVGAALANRKYGRFSVSIQSDGDFMFAPGVLWTAAHHRIPLLIIMHNNRAYYQEIMQIQMMANRHNRGVTRARIGTTLTDPAIDYSKIAQGMGIYGEGPILDPKDLGPALRKAIEVVKRGEPALVDVVTQGR